MKSIKCFLATALLSCTGIKAQPQSTNFQNQNQPERQQAQRHAQATTKQAQCLLQAPEILNSESASSEPYSRGTGITTSCACFGFFDGKGKSLQAALLANSPLVNGTRISSNFGMRKHPLLGYWLMHFGVDVAAPLGAPVHATGGGVIEEAGRRGTYGNYLRIRHSATYASAYAHLNGFAPGIRAGSRVTRGQVIGYVGSTGLSIGPHLHYEIFVNGWRVHPVCRCFPPSQPHGQNEARVTRERRLGRTAQTTQKEGL
jgi:murein DD-endopeptidase MepM/ murein hydrolase activator NlpD